jgi:hypothetical protein
MSVVSNTDTVATLGHRTLNSIESIRKHTVTVGGKKGYFVDPERLARLEERAKILCEKPDETSVDQSTLVKMMAEINTLRTDNERAINALSIVNADKAKLSGDVASMNESLTAMKHQAAKQASEMNSERDFLREKLKLAQANLASAKQNVRSADIDLNNSPMESYKNSIEEYRLEIEGLNKRLNGMNSVNASNSAKIKAYEADLISAKHALSLANQSQQSLKTALNEASGSKLTSTMPIDGLPAGAKIVLDPSVKKLLGNKAVSWLEQAIAVPATDVRDKAFHLMLVAKSSSNKRFESLHKLLTQVVTWIKTQSVKARAKLAPWLKMIEDDLRAGKVKTVMFYREQLESIVKLHKEAKEIKSLKKGYEYKLTWWDEVKIWSQILLVNRPRKYGRSILSNLKKFSSWVYARVFLSAKSRGKQKEQFTHHIEMIDGESASLTTDDFELPKRRKAAAKRIFPFGSK